MAFVLIVFGTARQSAGHWCSNIFVTYSRLIVKPAQSTINLTAGNSTTLRVYLQNNFPYKLVNTEMRGTATGYTITSTPANIQLYPGQKASFMLSITPQGGATGNVQTSTMGIQVRFRVGGSPVSGGQGASGGWMDDGNASMVNENPTKSQVESGANHFQHGSLDLALFSDLWPSDALGSSTFFGRTGAQQLIKMFGYRFCWNNTNSWRCLSQDCPSPCAEGTPWAGGDDRFEKSCMRAGVDLAVRKAALGAELTAARNGATNALKGWLASSSTCTNSPEDCPINAYKCLAAVVGAYLWTGASSTAPFTTELNAAANKVPTICKDAALRILGGSTSSTCTTGKYWERAACAAAEGIRNNTGPVTSVLMPRAGDGLTWSGTGLPTTDGMESLYYAAMLYIVASHHNSSSGTVPFYPDAGTSGCTTAAQCNDNNPCTTDTCVNNACQNTAVSGCCTTAAQCNDNNACTTDTCVSNACQHAPISGCCTANSQCNDNDPCTADTCASNACQNTAISGCCTTAAQCNDNNACTTDTCVSNACQHAPISGCCSSDAMCADNDPCTTDTCDTATGLCSNTKTAGCCAYDTDCDDSDPCTLDKCDTTSHTCSHTNTCVDAGPSADAAIDAGPVEAGAADSGGTEGGLQPDQSGGSGDDAGTLDGGCGCGVAREPARSPLPILLLLAVVAVIRRTRSIWMPPRR